MIQTVFTWLRGLPGLESLRLEALDAASGSAGLFCRGEKQLRQSRDILGRTSRRRSLSFQLCMHSTSRETPALFLTLDTSSAPILGEDQTVTVTQGHLTRDDGSGICRYEATITFTFTSEG